MKQIETFQIFFKNSSKKLREKHVTIKMANLILARSINKLFENIVADEKSDHKMFQPKKILLLLLQFHRKKS